METRLIQINSDHADPLDPQQSNTNFQVSLGNSTTELRTGVVGFSVESVSFVNLLPNVREGVNTFTVVRNGVEITMTIPGEQYYTIDRLAVEMQAAIDLTYGYPGELAVTVAVGANYDGGDMLSFQVLDAAVITMYIQSDGLGYQLGINDTLTVAGFFDPFPYDAVLTRTNLMGEHAVQLHTKHLIGSRTGIDGTGHTMDSVCTIPVTVEYGMIQSLYLAGDQRPTTLHGPQTHSELSIIDVSLRYLDGSLCWLENTKMHCTFRAWIMSK